MYSESFTSRSEALKREHALKRLSRAMKEVSLVWDRSMIHLRRATRDDAAAIAALHMASWRTAYRGILPDRYLDNLNAAEQTAIWRERFGAPQRVVLVAFDEEVLEGFCAVEPSPDDDADPTVWVVANLHVRPASRRSGIGTQLFDAAFDIARAHDVRRVTLWVLAKNLPARAFYEKHHMWLDGATRGDARSGVAVDLVRYAMDVERPVFPLR